MLPQRCPKCYPPPSHTFEGQCAKCQKEHLAKHGYALISAREASALAILAVQLTSGLEPKFHKCLKGASLKVARAMVAGQSDPTGDAVLKWASKRYAPQTQN